MNVLRFSAVETFGVPVDSGQQVETPQKTIELMRQYSAHEEEIPADRTDITPYYWENNSMRYFLSSLGATGLAVVEMQPKHEFASAIGVSYSLETGPTMREMEPSTLVIPEDMALFAMAGNSPRFTGQICIHELIVDMEAT
jgi:hypothetical protein